MPPHRANLTRFHGVFAPGAQLRPFLLPQAGARPEPEEDPLCQGSAHILEHVNQPRFRGVYFQLARLLEPERARELPDRLVAHAARTREHTVSDEFVNRFKARRSAEQVRARGEAPRADDT